MGVCTFLVRIIEPIGANILNMQLCFFSQYVLLFAVGVFAYRGNWLMRIPTRFGMVWLTLALTIGVVDWFALILTSGALQGNTQSLMGGLHWQSAAFSLLGIVRFLLASLFAVPITFVVSGFLRPRIPLLRRVL
jgi:hypothetical protein